MRMPEYTTSHSRPRDMRSLLTELAPFLRPYRRHIAAAMVFLLLAALATLAFPMALRQLIDGAINAATQGEEGTRATVLRAHFALLFGVSMAMGLASAARYYLMSWLGERVTADLRNAVYGHVLEQSPEFFETTQTGEVLSRLTADTTLVQTVVGSSLSMGLRNAVLGTGALGLLIWSTPYVMAFAFGAIVLIVLPSMWIGRRVRGLSRASQDRVADASAIAAEVLRAIPVVQSYTAETQEAARFSAATENALRTAMRRSAARAALMAFIMIASAALLLWALYMGALAVLAGTLSAGQLGQTILYAMFLAGSVAVLGEVYGDLLRAAGAMERLMELLATRSTLPMPSKPETPEISGDFSLVFTSVGFSYPSRPSQAALENFNLHLRAGETVALVGSSGAGKSTVFQLLQRFYDVNEGCITLGNVDLRAIEPQVLRRLIGVVPQDPVLFSASALDNIRYGSPHASHQEVEAAARAAFAHEFICTLPHGYDTFLGEHGVRLSGGQRQRIAIARALLKNAPVLLLDEATSALDAQSERAVQMALDTALHQPSRQRITLVIAHRLATVQHADRIVVMEQGRIVEAGRHEDLLRGNGVYARLAALQFSR